MTTQKSKTPWFLLPFVWVWKFLAFILELTGRLVGAVMGFVLMIVGAILIITVIAAPIGIPLAVFGFLLMLRSFF